MLVMGRAAARADPVVETVHTKPMRIQQVLVQSLDSASFVTSISMAINRVYWIAVEITSYVAQKILQLGTVLCGRDAAGSRSQAVARAGIVFGS
jgi:hypothetical protein